MKRKGKILVSKEKNRKRNSILTRGQLIVNLPVLLILSFSVFIPIFVFKDKLETSTVLISALIGFILAWVWWSFFVVKWKIWAYKNTPEKDWVKLTQEAIELKIMWEENSIFTKTEIRSKSEKQKLKQIYSKKH